MNNKKSFYEIISFSEKNQKPKTKSVYLIEVCRKIDNNTHQHDHFMAETEDGEYLILVNENQNRPVFDVEEAEEVLLSHGYEISGIQKYIKQPFSKQAN